MNNGNNPKFNQGETVENIDVNQSGEAPKAVKKTTIIIAVLLVAVALGLIIFGVTLTTGKGGNKNVVNTEFATTPNGSVVIEKGTNPQGVVIENGTYPDGTVVEVSTTPEGEPATEADGSYVVVYPTYNSSNGSSSESGENANNSSSNNSQTGSSASSNVTTSSQNSTPNSTASSTPNSSSAESSSNNSSASSNNSSSSQTGNNTSSTPSSPSSSTSSSSSTTDNSSNAGVVTINGSNYNVGDKIKVTCYLECPIKFAGMDSQLNYDGNVLKLDKNSVKISNLANVMSNLESENSVNFICASVTAANDFSSKKEFLSCEFEIQQANTKSADVALNIIEMLDNDIANITQEQYTVTTNIEKISWF